MIRAVLVSLPTVWLNLNGLMLLDCLSKANFFVETTRLDSAPCMDRASAFVSTRDPWGQSGISRYLSLFDDDANIQHGSFAYTIVPLGLAELQYNVALRSAAIEDWRESLEHFERAITVRPQGWSSSFYDHYKGGLARVFPAESDRMEREHLTTASQESLIKLGEMGQPGWDTPIRFGADWQLEGFTLRDWISLEHGFPVTADLFWKNSTAQIIRQTLTTDNMLPNGGFELGANWKSPSIAGWQTGGESGASKPIISLRAGRSSNNRVVVMPPSSGEQSTRYRLDTRYIIVRPKTVFLLWSAWIEASPGGNPQIYFFWYDHSHTYLRYEIAFINVTQESGRHYAGVIKVPEDAEYLLLRLANWNSSGNAQFDDLLLLSLEPISR